MPPTKFSGVSSACLAAALLAGLAASPARAQATLRWRFEPGETLKYEMRTKTNLRINASNGQKLENTMEQVIDTTWSVKTVEKGTAELSQTIDRIRTNMDSNVFGKFEFDSQEKKKPEGPVGQTLFPIFEALVGSEFSFKINERGEVADVKLPEKLVQALQKIPGAQAAGGQFSEEGLRQLITQSTLVLPAGPLSKGKSWGTKIEVPSGPVGSVVLNNSYTYDGPANQAGVDRIALNTQMDFKIKEGVPLKAEVKSQEGKGEYLFDRSKGHLNESKLSQKMEVVLSAMGMDTTQNVETTASMRLNQGGSGR